VTSARDNFTPRTRKVLAERVAVRCSNPDCQQTTSGPNSNPEKSMNIGVAAHITAAAPGGERYDDSLSNEERKSAENGIWLCQTCAKLVDNDPARYPVEVLYEWKRGAEARASALMSGPTTSSERHGASPSASLLASEVDRLAVQVSGMVEQDLGRMILAWREGRTGEALSWIEEIKGDETRWRALLPQLRARLLRFEASVSLNAMSGVEQARKLADEARAEAPLENDARLRAVIAYVKSGPEAAIELLAGQQDVDALNLKAGLLLETKRANRAEECRATLDFKGTDLEPNAETFRVRALSYLVSRDLDRAQLEIQKAKECGPQWESVRFTVAMIDYLSSLSPAALSVNKPVAWPEPVDWHLVKRDDRSTTRLREAARVFGELATSAEEIEERRRLETWRLACLANDPEAQDEAVGYCRALLEDNPAHYRAVLWAVARGFDVDLGPSEAALEEFVTEGSVEYAHVLALMSCYFVSDRSSEAIELLDETKPVFQEARADVLWNFWHAQALTLAGDPEAAVRSLDQAEPKTDLLRESRTVALRALAEKTSEWGRLVQHLESSYEETGNPAFLAKCCEVMAQQQDWSYVADRAEELVEKIGTDEALRLAVIAAYHSDRFRLCLELLDEHRGLFVQRKLPDDLRRIRSLSQSALGVLPKAVVEAEALVEDSPTLPNLTALAQLYFAKGDLKALAVISRRLYSTPDLPPEHHCLELSRLVQLEDQRLAASLWRKAVSQPLPDSLVGTAVTLGFQLNLEEEIGALQVRMMELASREEGNVQRFKAADIFSFFEKRQKQIAELNVLYRSARAPIHVIMEHANGPLSEPYHGVLSENEKAPAPMVQPFLFVRHGGRGPVTGFSDTLTERRLNLDITAILLAAHLEILQAVEEAFGPLRIPADLIRALVLMTKKSAHHQPSKFEEYREIVELVEAGSLQVVNPVSRPEHDAQLVEELGESWVAVFEEAREEDGYLLDFLPPTKLDLSGPPSALPEDADERLVNCRSVLEVLRRQGQLSDGEYSRALSRLGEEGRKEPSSATPEEGSILYCDGSIVELLAGVGLLRAACRLFQVRIEQRELDGARAALRYQERARKQIEWLNDLIGRLRSGVDSGSYEIIPAPPHKDEDPEIVQPAQLDLRCLETLFLFEAEESDLAWIDDRMANSYPARGSVPIVSIVEVLHALVGAGRMEPGEYYEKLERLRAANVRFIPVHQDEIVYHLCRAEVENTGVVEPRPLRTLRRYIAACLTRSEDLQRPPMPEGAPNQFGEIEFVVGINRAAASALIEVWKTNEEEYSRRVRSEWLLTNLYLDMPTLAHMTWSETTVQDDRYRLTVELAGLVAQAIQLERRGSEDEPSPRREYLDWLYDRVLRKRFSADPSLVNGVTESLKEYFTDMQGNVADQEQAPVANLLLRLFLSDLPEPLREELGLDADFMESIGDRHAKVATIGNVSFDPDEFWRASSEAINGREARIVPIDRGAEATFAPLEDENGTGGMRLVHPDGGETDVRDEILAVLSDSAVERETVLRRNRLWFDCPEDEFERAVAEIASGEDPQRRLDETELGVVLAPPHFTRTCMLN
jgi:tetratricopeptide (TPR) repeat protein